jgi:SAM-dependent methyltransferase
MEDKRRVDTNETVAYYDYNATEFVGDTVNADLSEIYKSFEELLCPGSKILDLGCGSGRDSKYFADHGYEVVAIDPSLAMCEYTRSIVDIPVFQMKAEDLYFHNEFDAVWACASLLHVPSDHQKVVLELIAESLKTGGICYCSWKYGCGERVDSGRRFVDYTDTSLRELVDSITAYQIVKLWITHDVRHEKNQKWINALIKKR